MMVHRLFDKACGVFRYGKNSGTLSEGLATPVYTIVLINQCWIFADMWVQITCHQSYSRRQCIDVASYIIIAILNHLSK